MNFRTFITITIIGWQKQKSERLNILNGKIPLDLLNQDKLSFKLKCKATFLPTPIIWNSVQCYAMLNIKTLIYSSTQLKSHFNQQFFTLYDFYPFYSINDKLILSFCINTCWKEQINYSKSKSMLIKTERSSR